MWLALQCMNRARVHSSRALRFAVNPPTAQAELDIVASGGTSMGSAQGSRWEEKELQSQARRQKRELMQS